MVHVVLEVGKSRFEVRADRDPGEPMVQVKLELVASPLQNSFLVGKAGLFVLFRPSACHMRFTHMMEGNLLTQSPPS